MKKMIVAALAAASVNLLAATQSPDLSGTWVATTEAPAASSNLTAAPSAILGAKIAFSQSGKSLTMLRTMRDLVASVTFEIGGPEVRSIVPGPICIGDSQLIETAASEGDAIVLAITGTQAAGAAAPVKFNARRLVRRVSADTLLVEGTVNQGGQVKQVGTIYRKSTDVMTPTPRPAASRAGSISGVSWIGGTWSTAGLATPPPTTTEERWTPPAGGSMLGVAREVRNTSLASFEFLCIVERNGGLVYTAMPNARTPATDFAMTAMTETSITFENPGHDYPKKIRYSLTPEGLMQTEVSGAAGSRTITVTLKKQ